MLGELDHQAKVVIADLEAGVGTLSRLPENGVDALVVVAEPSVKSVEVARKVADIASSAHSETRPILVANKVGGPEDLAFVEENLPGPKVVVPLDPKVSAADRHGAAPLDFAPGSSAVVAISRLADLLKTGVEVVV